MYRSDESMSGGPADQPALSPSLPTETAGTGGPPIQLEFVGRIKRWDAELLFDFAAPADATETDINAAAWRALTEQLQRGQGWRIDVSQIDGTSPVQDGSPLSGTCGGCGALLTVAIQDQNKRLRGACPNCGREHFVAANPPDWTDLKRRRAS
ncbi:hypothetical protein [Methylomagnum sp.]